MPVSGWVRRGPARAIDRGREHFRSADFESAAECFARAARDVPHPEHPLRGRALRLLAGAHAQRGVALMHLARFAEAEQALDLALAADTGTPGVRECRARIFFRSGRVREAIEDLDRALIARPDDPDLHLLRAACWAQCHDRRRAAAALERALHGVLALPGAAAAAGWPVPRSHGGGDAGAERGPARDPGERPALEGLTALAAEVRSRPFYADLRYRLACLLVEAGRAEEAEAQLARALRINPDYLEARLLAARLGMAHRAERAAADLEAEAARHPGYPDVWCWLALARLRVGEAEPAREALERSVALNRHFARAHRLLAVAHHRAGRLDEALRCLKRGFLHDREPPSGVPGARTWGSVRAGDEHACGEIERAVRRHPDFPDLQVGAARARRSRGDRARAREACQVALGLNPAYGAATLELARLELELWRPAEAERLLVSLVRRQPRWMDAWDLLARARAGRASGSGGTVLEPVSAA